MSKIFITGSADGLGQLAAQLLVTQGHDVTLHARDASRAKDAMKAVPGASRVLVADLSNVEETKKLAAEANTIGRFDAVIHNAGVYNAPSAQIVHVNTLAPYVLTCLMEKPRRLIYLSSGMHLSGTPNLDALQSAAGKITYSDSKLHNVILAKAVARKFPTLYSNAVNPGWVPTKMGGRGAPDDLTQGFETQVWLAVSNDREALVSGRYFFHKKESRSVPEAGDNHIQDKFLEACEKKTGVSFH